MKKGRLAACAFILVAIGAQWGCGQNYNSDSDDAEFANMGTAQPTYTYLSQNLFNQCTGCHYAGNSQGIPDFSSYSAIMSSGQLQPGDPNGSNIYTYVESGQMPQGGPDLETTDPSLVSALEDWIQNGAQQN